MSAGRLALGRLGEETAAEYLMQEGMQILHRNYRTPRGEIDLLALINGTLVVVEVKSRRSDLYGEGYEAVTIAKQRKLRQLTSMFLSGSDTYYSSIRFDVISLLFDSGNTLVSLKHFENAF